MTFSVRRTYIRRMKVARVTVALLAVAVLAGCGGRAHGQAATRLTILAVDPNVGRAVFHLSCAPAGGDVPAPARACAALERTPGLVRRPVPFVCHGPAWWDLTISGRLDGHPLSRHVGTCWTPQMALIGRLGIAPSLQRHLQPRRTGAVLPGASRTFPGGVLRPGDAVVCEALGRRLVTGVPVASGQTEETGYDSVGGGSISLGVTRHRDGSVTATCS